MTWRRADTTTEAVDLAVCVDCLMMAAGYSEHELGHEYPEAVKAAPARVSADNGGVRVDIVLGNSEESEPHFSWSPCELCLSTLGGDRHPVTLLITDEPGRADT